MVGKLGKQKVKRRERYFAYFVVDILDTISLRTKRVRGRGGNKQIEGVTGERVGRQAGEKKAGQYGWGIDR